MGFSFGHLVHAPGVGLVGAGGSKIKFSEHGHVAYTLKKIYPRIKLVTLGGGQKVKYH